MFVLFAQDRKESKASAVVTAAAAGPHAPSHLARVLRRAKYYVLINAFVCSVAFASHKLVPHFQSSVWSSSSNLLYVIAGVYSAALMRIAVMVTWFDWIGTMKAKILGDKRTQLTAAQKRSIQLRILWLVVPIECLTFWIARPESLVPSQVVDLRSFLLEFTAFLPKSLVFEVVFDFFYFATHLLCHQSTWLYQHAHKRHHMHLHPCPLVAYEQDAIDLCLTNVLPFFLATYIGFPLTTFQLHLIFAYKAYTEVAGHSGLEVKGFSFPQLPWVNVFSVCLRVHDHDLHHTHPKFNFAKSFTLWDKMFGTFRPGRPLQEPTKLC